jgi:tetratricopeptide (TPR) repeat protein
MTDLERDNVEVGVDRSLRAWQAIQRAHHMMCRAEYFQALKEYRRELKKLRTYLTLPDWCSLSNSEDRPSRNWLCVYLFEYYQISHGWQGWRWLAQPVLKSPDLEKLSLRAWSRFQSALGWSYVRYKPLKEIRRMQHAALERLAGQNMPFEEALHHFVLCQVEQIAVRQAQANYHAESALALLKFEETPFYVMRTLFVHNNMYRIMREYDKAQALVDQLREYAEQKGVLRTALGPHIVQGWIHSDLEEYDRAEACFQEAIDFLDEQRLPYERGRALYALGRLHLWHRGFDMAEKLITEAISIYSDDTRYDDPDYVHYLKQGTRSVVAQATYQNVLVSVLAERGQIDLAVEIEQEVLFLLKDVDDRGTHYDILNTLARLHAKKGNRLQSICYRLRAFLMEPRLFIRHNWSDMRSRLKKLLARLRRR